MMIIRMKYLALLSTVTLLILAPSSGHAAEGAGAPIPSRTQSNINMNYDLSTPSGSRDYAYENERFPETVPRVQEDPDAGNRVMQREKPVSYFKRDERTTLLPKR